MKYGKIFQSQIYNQLKLRWIKQSRFQESLQKQNENVDHILQIQFQKVSTIKMDKAEWVLRTANHVEYELRVDFSESDLQLIKFKLDKAEQVPRKTIETECESSLHFAESAPKIINI